MRLVLDTNTALSALLWRGTPGKLIDAAQSGQVLLITSLPLLVELQGVLARAKFAKQLEARYLTVSDIFDGYAALATVVKPAIIKPVITRDPADDLVLATALAAQADAIVSGDRHLLELEVYQDIPIVGAAEAVKRLSA